MPQTAPSAERSGGGRTVAAQKDARRGQLDRLYVSAGVAQSLLSGSHASAARDVKAGPVDVELPGIEQLAVRGDPALGAAVVEAARMDKAGDERSCLDVAGLVDVWAISERDISACAQR